MKIILLKNTTPFRIKIYSIFCNPFSIEKSSSIHSDVNRADQASLIRSSLASLSTSQSAAIACKLCLNDVRMDKMTSIQQCGCQFCIDVSILLLFFFRCFFFSLSFSQWILYGIKNGSNFQCN